MPLPHQYPADQRLRGLVQIMPLYRLLKARAEAAVVQLKKNPETWGPVSLANALGISPSHVQILQDWALLPRPLDRQKTLRWLEGLARL